LTGRLGKVTERVTVPPAGTPLMVILAALAAVKLAGAPVSAVVATEEKAATVPVPPVTVTFRVVVLVTTLIVKVFCTGTLFKSFNSITNV